MIIWTEKNQMVRIADKVLCNMCGEEIKAHIEVPGQFEFAILRASWGYGSQHDTQKFQLEICEDCIYRRLLPVLKILPETTESI